MRNWAILFLLIVCGILFMLVLKSDFKKPNIICPKKYLFISPDLNCAEDAQLQTIILRDSINKVVENNLLIKRADKISIFYRNLDNKQWFGINENENFAPGSLLKLPLAIAYYKMAEIDPNILDQQYIYKPKSDEKNLYDVQNIKPEKTLQDGKTYSVSELIKNMIQYSDNEAVPLLAGSINQSFFNKVYIDLGVYFPKTGGIEQDFISVKTYGAILRTLYTASYLNQKYSNDLLEIMSGSSFKSGIALGVDKDVKVANKFGERKVVDPVSNKVVIAEIHDCGIIYTSSPYILCIMTKGSDYNDLLKVVSDISKAVYKNR